MSQLVSVSFHMLVAVFLGALIGIEREHAGQAAGLRTHMLVALATAMFTLLMPLQPGSTSADMSRVIQGIATGIGFVGAGAILKMADQQQIRGLTTAASIWATAAAGTAVGMGRVWIAVLGSIVAWFILSKLKRIEHYVQGTSAREGHGPSSPNQTGE